MLQGDPNVSENRDILGGFKHDPRGAKWSMTPAMQIEQPTPVNAESPTREFYRCGHR